MSSYYGSSNYYGNNNDPSGGSGGGYAGGQHQQQHQSSSQNPNQQQPQQQQPYYQPASDTGGYAAGGYNVKQWQMPSEQQQGYSQPVQPGAYGSQQQPQQPSLSFWNPATVATVASLAGAAGSASSNHAGQDAMLLDLAGKTLMHSSGSAARVLIPGFSTSMHMLRPYFAVDNRFILKKMQRMLFPFVFTNWSRQPLETSSGSDHPNALQATSYALPHSDENAPDLYLPSMSLISYVLLCALCYGTAGKFDPEVLPDVTTKCFVTQIMEVLLIRFGFYLLQVPVALLDLLCYTGYKYLGLCVTLSSAMLMKLLINYKGRGVYYVAFLWTASAASFVMLKTMANNIPKVTAPTGPKREVVVLAFCILQFAAMWFVSQTKFL